MTKHGDFCLPPGVLARVLTVLILAKLTLFTWGLFAPATPLNVVLILAAIALLAPAYFVKVFLKYGGEEGTFWTRVAGCVSSAMIALGSLALAWGAGNGLRHFTSPEIFTIALFGLYTLVFVLVSFIDTLEFVLKERDKNRERVNR